MIQNDKQERDKAEARNSVEEYVYDMREKLCDRYEKFVTEEVGVFASDPHLFKCLVV